MRAVRRSTEAPIAATLAANASDPGTAPHGPRTSDASPVSGGQDENARQAGRRARRARAASMAVR